MALRTFESSVPEDDDLPWSNDYITEGGEPDTASLVTKVVKSPKGLMVIAQDFKGFLFTKSSIYAYLLEALEVWKSNSTTNHPLFAIVLSNGKITLAVDDELPPTVWIESTKNKAWEQKSKKNKGDGLKQTASNPFLPTPPPASTSTRRGNTKLSTEDVSPIGH